MTRKGLLNTVVCFYYKWMNPTYFYYNSLKIFTLPTTGVMFTGSRSVPVVGGGHSWQLLSPLCGKGGEMEVCATQPRLSVNGPLSYLPRGRLR